MTSPVTPGQPTGGKAINLTQLEQEINAAGVVTHGLGGAADHVFVYDGTGAPTDFPTADQPNVDQAIAAHIAMRDKTDDEYSVEFQDPNTTAVRRQEIRDMLAGLLPREQVRVDGQPMQPPAPPPDPLAAIKSATGVDSLRDALVAYFEAR